MAHGTAVNNGSTDRSATATVELLPESPDAKASTHLCVSPFADARNGAAIGHTGLGSTSAYLIMVSGGIPGTMFRVPDGAASVGRAAECTYQVHDITVSRVHAIFTVEPGGNVYVGDEASTNGTFVNGVRLVAHKPVLLRDGDRVQIGTAVILKLVRLEPDDEEFQREMFERTVRDTLTGLYNRAYFLDQIRALSERNAALGLGIAVMMLDVNHFKAVNDLYGHFAGDIVLKEVAAVLRESTRNEDLVARFGGEEFVIALPAASAPPAAERAERIRTSLERRQIMAGEDEISVTASLGMAFNPPNCASNDNGLIVMADRALYQAKSEGRNRVVIAGPMKSPSSQTEIFE